MVTDDKMQTMSCMNYRSTLAHRLQYKSIHSFLELYHLYQSSVFSHREDSQFQSSGWLWPRLCGGCMFSFVYVRYSFVVGLIGDLNY